MRHPNVLRYLNEMHGRKQIAEQFTFNEILLAKIAPNFSPEGWEALIQMAAEETDKLWGKNQPKELTLCQEYRLSLLPKARMQAGVSQ